MDVTIQRVPGQPTACVHAHASIGQIGETFREALPRVIHHVEEVGAVIAGPPYTRYLAYGPEGVDMEIGFPTVTEIPHNGDVAPAELPEVEAAIAVHEGPYERLGATYEAMEHWIREHGHVPAEGMWEIYLNDPGAVPPDQLRTEIVWPLKS
ncbi:MAG TPA: GyrI-like domain-containing protein [Candidatus Limnocylindria bacterium]|jgi:effector-binding domain-containing protein